MTKVTAPILLSIGLTFCGHLAPAHAQTRRAQTQPVKTAASGQTAPKTREIGSTAVVIDETLSVLREKPSLFAQSIQRMRRGRVVKIISMADADGVRFYKVAVPPSKIGWVQAEAVFGNFRTGDEERLARLVQASEGFEQIEIANEFFSLYPKSQFRP